MKSNRFTLIDKENVQIDIEYNDMYFVLHMPRLKLTKDTYLDLKYGIEDLWQFAKTIQYQGMWIAVDPNNKKIEKLIKRLNFKYIGEADNMFIYQYEEQ